MGPKNVPVAKHPAHQLRIVDVGTNDKKSRPDRLRAQGIEEFRRRDVVGNGMPPGPGEGGADSAIF